MKKSDVLYFRILYTFNLLFFIFLTLHPFGYSIDSVRMSEGPHHFSTLKTDDFIIVQILESNKPFKKTTSSYGINSDIVDQINYINNDADHQLTQASQLAKSISEAFLFKSFLTIYFSTDC